VGTEKTGQVCSPGCTSNAKTPRLTTEPRL
jgi:hypothetical protein